VGTNFSAMYGNIVYIYSYVPYVAVFLRGDNVANLKAVTRKLQKAILSTGLIIKIGTSQFYSHEQEQLITVTIISTPVFRPTKHGNWKDCDYEILRTASQYDVVMCLKEIWEAVRK